MHARKTKRSGFVDGSTAEQGAAADTPALLAVGRDDLAGKVEWVAETIGDGLGFDVFSFLETDGSEKLIEVKKTGSPVIRVPYSFPLTGVAEVR